MDYFFYFKIVYIVYIHAYQYEQLKDRNGLELAADRSMEMPCILQVRRRCRA